jgi:hypothetical protein
VCSWFEYYSISFELGSTLVLCVIFLQPEPFFLSFSLYNAKEGRKISEDFHIDPNSAEIRSMIPNDLMRSNSVSVNGTATSNKSGEPALNGPDPRWLESQKQVCMYVSI